MKNIGLWINVQKPQALKAAGEIGSRISAAGGNPMRIFPKEILPELMNIPVIGGEPAISKCDMIIVLGGDGTLLAAARNLASFGIPLMGINMGRRGFLASAEAEDVKSILESIYKGDYILDERMMLEAALEDGQGRQLALNDLGVFNGQRGRMIRLLVKVNDEILDEYYADGILISSPTGSTAYSLSAGGPLITPQMECMLITPICAHSLHTRPVVVGADSQVSIQAGMRFSDAEMTADGQVRTPLRTGQTVIIRKAPHSVKLIRLKKQGFFEVVRQKISEWGTADLKNGGA